MYAWRTPPSGISVSIIPDQYLKIKLLTVSQGFPDHKFPVAFAEQLSEGFLLFKQHMLL